MADLRWEIEVAKAIAQLATELHVPPLFDVDIITAVLSDSEPVPKAETNRMPPPAPPKHGGRDRTK